MEIAKREAAAAQQVREEKAKLEATLEYTQKELHETKEQLEDGRSQIVQLSRQLGEEYVRGVMEALERKGELPRKDGAG